MVVSLRLLDTAFWLQLVTQLLVTLTVISSSPPTCPLLNDNRITLPTLGSAGIKFFTDPLGKPLIASANFWDGVSRDMSALTTVHELYQSDNLSVSSPVMTIPTKGAHGVDAFETTDGTKMVVIVNYYGCGGSVEESREKKFRGCRSTAIYSWTDKGTTPTTTVTESLSEVGRLSTNGPSQSNHFTYRNVTYIVVAENFVNLVSIYRIKKQIIPSASSSSTSTLSEKVTSLKFDKVQSLTCVGAAAVAVYPTEPFSESTSIHHTDSTPAIDGVILVCASYHNPQGTQGGWRTKSPVFFLDGRTKTIDTSNSPSRGGIENGSGRKSRVYGSIRQLEEEENELLFGIEPIQEISTLAAHDVEVAQHRDSLYLFFAEDRDDVTSKVHSQVFVMDLKDKMNGRGCSTGVNNESDGSDSSISTATIRSDSRIAANDDGTCLADMIVPPSFSFLQSIPTDGAHGASFFVTQKGHLMLAVANFGDRLGKPPRYDALSSLWRLEEQEPGLSPGQRPEITDNITSSTTSTSFVLACEILTHGATDWEYFELSITTNTSSIYTQHKYGYLAVSNEGNLGTLTHQQSDLYRLLRMSG